MLGDEVFKDETVCSIWSVAIANTERKRSINLTLYLCNDGSKDLDVPENLYIKSINPIAPILLQECSLGKVKHIYFVAETKGFLSSVQLREVESAKIHCAREPFKAISTDSVKYDVVDSYAKLMDEDMR